MEMKRQEKNNRCSCIKRKRKSKLAYTDDNGVQNVPESKCNLDTVFPLLVAALSNCHTQQYSLSVIKKCLKKFRVSVKQTLLDNRIISLLPVILKSKHARIVSFGAEIVGAASLFSSEMNEQIALDSETLKALLSVLASPTKRVSLSACNAVLDLCTTSIGRQSLLHSSALHALIFGFLQVHKCSVSAFLSTLDGGKITHSSIGFKGDELPVLLLNATIDLINNCNIEQLEKIQMNLSKTLLVFLKKLWAHIRSQMLHYNSMNSNHKKHLYVSNIRIKDLAETIFRLSIFSGLLSMPLSFEMLEKGLFGLIRSGFEDFISNYWEVSPFLVGRFSHALDEKDSIFSPFIHLNSGGAFPSLLSSILQDMSSCIPIASDELDILSFLNEARHKLGCPIIYQQDIRVLKTNRSLKKEEHFFKFLLNSMSEKDSQIFNIDDTLRCEEAYKEGYTIALRGMEFRFESIAKVASGLAYMFGQPSIGVNMYLTPPNTQGLACHYDDHCVFVCQLFGTKQWKVFSQSNVQLPRLYDTLHAPEVDSSIAGCKHFSLQEGDILYIPRGIPHEAHTNNNDGSTGFSLHLTLGVEIEPPFEWEGFIHTALFYWSQNQEQPCYTSECTSSIPYEIPVSFLHIAIQLMATSKPTFRKACLAAANLPACSNNLLDMNHRIFYSLIDKINAEASFLEVVKHMGDAIEKHEDPLERIKWLLQLSLETTEGCDWHIPYRGAENLLRSCLGDRDATEAAFMHIKYRFCVEVSFEDVTKRYKMLLEKYRRVREQYMNGMISLNCGSSSSSSSQVHN